MKKIFTHIIPVLFAVFMVKELVNAHASGQSGKAGSAGEGTCTSCHSDFSLNSGPGSLTLTSDIPASGYVLGQTYTISVKVAQGTMPLFGFDCEALTSGNANAGTITVTNSTQTQLMTSSNGRTNITHKRNGGLSTGSATFSFSWTAPATNVGNVTFYVSGLSANKSGDESGDYVYNKTFVFSPATATNAITTSALSSNSFCQGQTGISIPYTITGTYNSGNVFTAQLSSATGSFASPTTLGSVTSTTAGTIVTTVGLPAVAGTQYRVRVVSSNPSVTGADNGTNLTINLAPTVSNAGADQTICSTTATLAGNTPTVGTGTWTLVAGTGTITSSSNPSSTVTGLGAGTNKLVWTISNGTCTASTDTVLINVNTPPTASNAGTDQTICGTSATLAGNTPTVGTGTWSLVSGSGSITTPSSPTSAVTGLGVGVNKFIWTISNSGCTASVDTVVINVSATPTTANAGPDQSICGTATSLAGNVPTTGNGTWTLASGSGTITTPSSATSSVTGLGVGINKFVWTITSGTCPSSRDTVVITGTASPTTANAGPDQSVCGTTATLAGNTPAVGTGTWSLVSGTGTITTPSNPTSTVTGLGVGANKLIWSVTNGICTPSVDTVIITGIAAPTTANAGVDQTVCSTTAALAGNTPASGNGVWTLVSGTGTITAPANPTSTITGLGIGVNKFVWTISNGTCTSSSDTVNITGVAAPSVANAGPDQTACTSTATLAGNTPTVGTGSWSLVSGSGIISTPSSPTSTVTGLGVGANKFVWTISNAPCNASRDTVVITQAGSITVANAGPDQSVCGTTAALAGNTPSVGTGSWSLVSGSGTVTTPSSPTSTVTGLGIGANKFVWTISNPPCSPSIDTVVITGVASPTTANAGPDQTACTSTAVLAGNTPTVGTGSWSLASGSGTITTPSNPTSTVTGLGVGSNKFVWTISNAPCNASRDTVIINQTGSITTANAGSDQTVCGTTATLSGNTPIVGTGSWSLISGSGVITNSSSPSSVVTSLGVGPNKFVWTISNAPCSPSTDTVIITGVAAPTIANAGVDQTVCGTSVTLAANTPTSGTGIWSLLSGNGTITNPSNPNSSVTGLGTGTNKFIWTISNAPCNASADTVTVISYASPSTANAGPDQSVCGSSATLSGNTPSVGSGAWSVLSGSGNITNVSSANSTVTNLGIGVNKFIWAISNGSCNISTDTVVIISYAAPSVANAGVDQTICTSTVTLSGNTPSVGTGSWSLLSGGGTITNPSLTNSTVTGLGTGVNKFIWTISNGVCTASYDTVNITVNPSPSAANAGVDQTICGTTASLAANTPLIGNGIWNVISGAGTVVNPSNPNSAVTGLSVGINKFEWIISNGVCTSSRDTVVITTAVAPTTANAGTNQSVCANTATLAANTPVIGSGRWSLVSGSGTVTTPNSPTSTVTNLGLGANTFRWTITNAPCNASVSDVVITYNNCVPNTITTSTSIAGSPFCAGTSYDVIIPFTTTGTFTGTYTAQLSDATGSFVNPVNIGTGTASPIHGTIPVATPAGDAYLIRIVNSNPSVTGSDNGTGLSVNNCKEINTGAIATGPYCSNTSLRINVSFSTVGVLTGPYVVELSDSSGSFSNNPLTIGYGYSSPIGVTIPSGLKAGNHYRVRVISLYDGVEGTDNGSDIAINTCSLTAIINNKNEVLELYPNPNSGRFVIIPDKTGEATVSVIGVLGNELIHKNELIYKGQPYEINAEGLEKGLYIIRVSYENEMYMGSFIIE